MNTQLCTHKTHITYVANFLLYCYLSPHYIISPSSTLLKLMRSHTLKYLLLFLFFLPRISALKKQTKQLISR